MSTQLFEQVDFVENTVYEQVITSLLDQKYAIVDDFFTAEEIEELRQSLKMVYEADCFKKAAIGNKFNEEIDKSIRGDFIKWINEAEGRAEERLFFSKINDLVAYLNRTCFLGILQKEFHYAIYPKGTFYKRHLDTFQNDSRRKLSMVCYLNDASWLASNGGELTLYLPDETGEQALDIIPRPGRVVIFESQILEHEVKPVLNSERLSITGWLKTR
ncbi:2OG-Fe(II) oxygenase [Leeuwenhoekiella polynyae]|uniref:SM-20-related protein n=1 Tax=Leeuwenhoekiella polynyae TaxID=1550906 RepID=A0A4Q0P838_9FLAO|nr:2OG-Fe(II) oxygenase [Leeuwenhoekiella polynyae]RXG22890.1 SM-20-related protein [Leeuwenhoekiella polynyae]